MPEPVIVIVGGGFAGAVTAIKLAEAGWRGPVTIVEPRSELGRGIAYSTTDPGHLVNDPARLFGLIPAIPGTCRAGWRTMRIGAAGAG